MPPAQLVSVNFGDPGVWKQFWTKKFEDMGGVYHVIPRDQKP